MSNPEMNDAEIALAVEEFLGTIPSEVPTCIHVHEDMIDVHQGLSLDTGQPMVVIQVTATIANEDGTYSEIALGLDEDACVRLLFGLHQTGTEIWGEEVDEDTDEYLG